ncbi:MAG TPA: hypothetical protein VL244_08545, partial [Alphaproteobacteria bacterium]|nr:hypothetical protein [Alphaproteobacteria bacterium]
MNGRSARGDEQRRLSPLWATILVLLAFFLEVVAWLWVLGPPEEVAAPVAMRVTVHLPPPVAAPAESPAPPPPPPPP